MTFKDTVKGWFQTGDFPTQDQFYQKFDMLRWNDQAIGIAEITGLVDILNDLSTGTGGGGGGGGNTIRTGAGAPSDALGVNGDLYIDTVSPYNFYLRVLGAYELKGSMQGATGPAGAAGVAGATGPIGPKSAGGKLFNYYNFK